MDIYAQNILDRYKSPFYKGKTIEPTLSHEEANHSCGDRVRTSLKLKEGRLSAYAFEGEGCAISMAAADMLGDLTEDMEAEEVLALNKEELYEALGIEISTRRSKCALLGLLALQNAILSDRGEGLKSWSDYHIS